MTLRVNFYLLFFIILQSGYAQFVHFWTPTSSTFVNNYHNNYSDLHIKSGIAASDRVLVFKMPYDTLLSPSSLLYKIQQGRRIGEYKKSIATIDSLLKTDPDNAVYLKEKILVNLRLDGDSYDKADSLYQGIKYKLSAKDTAYLYTTISFYKGWKEIKDIIKIYSRLLISSLFVVFRTTN